MYPSLPNRFRNAFAVFLGALLLLSVSRAEDIDIFTGLSAGDNGNPNILIVLDNTSNWARQSQQWPGGIQQGQSEVAAIKALISDSSIINDNVNLGLFEFVTSGTANDNGGFVRFHMQSMTDSAKTNFSTVLDTIYSDINGTKEKRNANTEYGNLLYDVYNYLRSRDAYSPNGVEPAPYADDSGYNARYTRFKSPLTSDMGCARTFMIFIGNPNSSGPADDGSANTTTLSTLGGSTTNIPLPLFSTATSPTTTNFYSACTSASSCDPVTLAPTECKSATDKKSVVTYESCSCTGTETTYQDCASGSLRYTLDKTVAASTATVGTTSACTASAPATFPDFTSCTASGNSCAVGAATATSGSCPSGTQRYMVQDSSSSTSSTLGPTAGCYASQPAASSTEFSADCSGSGVSCTAAAAATSGSCAAGSQRYMVQDYVSSSTSTTSSACYLTTSPPTAASLDATCGTSGISCTSPAQAANTNTCPSGTARYMIEGYNISNGKSSGDLGYTYACYSSSASATADTGLGSSGYACSGSCQAKRLKTSSSTSGTLTCPTGAKAYSFTKTSTSTTDKGYTLACYSSSGSASTTGYSCTGTCQINASSISTDALSCPSSTSAYTFQRSTGTTLTDMGYTLACHASSGSAATTGYTCTGNNGCVIDGSQTSTGSLSCPSGYQSYEVSQTTAASSSSLGLTAQCYASTDAATAAAPTEQPVACVGSGVSCAASTSTTSSLSASVCASGKRYQIAGVSNQTTVTPTGNYSTSSNSWNADEWSRFLHNTDVNGSASGNQSVTTYTIDVFNAQQNADTTALLMSMANVGGGKYFAARNQNMILDALKRIVAEIKSVNTAFAAASIPLSTTNRSQNLNQVFIGVFRADPNANPRWFGNLKQYRIGTVNNRLDLVDLYGNSATDSQTGFIFDCATSYFTTDSGNYWENLNFAISPSPVTQCTSRPSASTSTYSDLPDGASVEKGSVAEVMRKGNNPPNTNTTPTWEVNRTLYTRSGGTFVTFNTTNSGLSGDLVNYTSGIDINVSGSHLAEQSYSSLITPLPTSPTRPSIHGDVVHSRPLAVDYGGSTGTVVFYGSNDGFYRAVNGTTGKELWAFLPPEFFGRLNRLMANDPVIKYPNVSVAGAQPKDYFFDGSTGLRQNADNTAVWIFPTQRRGGRMVYGIDVTNPASPSLKWYQGCPTHLTASGNDTGCTSGFEGIGQTWGTPVVVKIKGYSTSNYLVALGGGYDTCEDANTSAPSCSTPKGNKVYFMDANDGSLKKTFDTDRSVVGDVAVVDVDNDGMADYAYVADTGGNIYRISFIDSPTTRNALAAANWSIKKIAFTNPGRGRKFMFAPALFPTRVALGSPVEYVYLAIATGDREHPLSTDYPYTQPVNNHIYVILDQLTAYNATVTAFNLSTSTANYGNSTSTGTCNNASIIPGTTPFTTGTKGWRISMLTGEQAVTPAAILGGRMTVNTNRPITSAQSCNVAQGEGGGYWLNLFNAAGGISDSKACTEDTAPARRSAFVGIGMPTPPVIINIAGKDPIVIGGVPTKPSSGTPTIFNPSEFQLQVPPTRNRKYQFKKVDR